MGQSASSVVVRCLYGAWMCRDDLLFAIQRLACRFTKWTTTQDHQLWYLMSYIETSVDDLMSSWIGDDPQDLHIAVYADADFAGDPSTMKSTSGVLFVLKGQNTFLCLAAQSKRQTAVSHSTPEAEMVAAAYALRQIGEVIMAIAVPLWKGAFNLDVKLSLYEDNETAYRIFQHGKNPTLRYLGRAHGVSLGYLVDSFNDLRSGTDIRKADTTEQKADIFTKCFKPGDWKVVRRNIGILTPEERSTLRQGEGTWMPYTGKENVQVPYLETAKRHYDIDWGAENFTEDSDDGDSNESYFYEKEHDMEFDPWDEWGLRKPFTSKSTEHTHEKVERNATYKSLEGVDVP